jgi:hypothetical protein
VVIRYATRPRAITPRASDIPAVARSERRCDEGEPKKSSEEMTSARMIHHESAGSGCGPRMKNETPNLSKLHHVVPDTAVLGQPHNVRRHGLHDPLVLLGIAMPIVH